jgi:HKD family nuclease
MVAALEHSILNLPGEPRMLDAVRAGLAGAEEALLAVSFTRCSGLQLLVDPLQEVVERRGRVRLLTSTYQQVTQPEALEALLELEGVECRVQEGPTGFHAKFWWFR